MAYGITNRYGGGVPEWMRSLSASARKIITPEAIERIIQKQVEKAEQGNPQAAQFVMELFAAANTVADRETIQTTAAPAPVRIEQHEGESEKTAVRRLIRAALKEVKQASPGELAARTGVAEHLVKRVLRTSGAFRRCPTRKELWEIEPQIA